MTKRLPSGKNFSPKAKSIRLDDDTNFWTMGPTGPCGPCSEILWDRGAEWSCGKPTCSPACDCDRYLEVWNHVFTQFDRSADGKLTPLPSKNIDTGMGLERLSLLLQGGESPFDLDTFQSIFNHCDAGKNRRQKHSQRNEEFAPKDTAANRTFASHRRIADHARAVTFMINDGILPSNEGRGYVLRRLLRQAIRAGKTVGIEKPFLFQLTGTVIETMKSAYPDLKTAPRDHRFGSEGGRRKVFGDAGYLGTRRLEDLIWRRPSRRR